MKTIVTHFYPDVDAVTSVWLVKTFFSDWEEAMIGFVPAGGTLEGQPVDNDPEIVHVDTGLGRFDHHQTNDDTCAAKLVFEYLSESRSSNQEPGRKDRNPKREKGVVVWHEDVLARLVSVVNDIDHFREVVWPEVSSDRFEFSFESILEGWKLAGKDNDREVVERGMTVLDGIYASLINKSWAEEELVRGQGFESIWGKAIAVATINNEVAKMAMKQEYMLTVLKDPRKGFVRIKARPGSGADLTQAYEKLRQQDPESSWYLHPSKMILLNGSSKNPNMKATKLGLDEVIKILERGSIQT